ncbi:CCHC-type domain-containing protein [Trichonephila clavata]|uniref:CCHC-type domain-containing protein n=1 Tax=Trichonephila clavata TaxID=2740835 RepID=A0A8X6K303_TRICU|nr:CCHC-type domain-containing protein [Trichonephila clavata]
MANIFKATKGFLKEDLLFVAEEIGEIFPDKVKISELKDIILKSKEYLDDPDFVTNILVTAVSERKLKEEFEKAERLKQLEYEESGKIRGHELDSAFLLGSTIQYHSEKKLEEAKQDHGKYPECIAQKFMSSFYVDNCLASVHTQSELDRFIDVATEIMAKRKFDLRGWEHSIPSDPIASPTNVLGMIWDRHCDTLSLNIPDLRELMEGVITKKIFLLLHTNFLTPWGSLVQCCYYQNFGYKVCGSLKLVGIKKYI